MNRVDLKAWLVEPIDPLVMGDGRSIGTVGVTRSRTLPPPSQLAGAVRSQAGSDEAGRWTSSASAVLPLTVWGPIGATLGAADAIVDWWLPAPADAVVMADSAEPEDRVRRRVPLSLPEGCAWGPEVDPAVGLPRPDPRKPDSGASRFWSWNHGLLPWLSGRSVDIARFQVAGPAPETRTHVSIGPSDTALDGALFGVTGVRFATARKDDDAERHPWGVAPSTHERYGLVFSTDATLSQPRIRPFGGERRLASWRRLSDVPWPEMSPEILASVEAGFVRLYLVTPALFHGGHRPDPGRLLAGVDGRVVASASGRAEVVSGWDFAARPQRPKPTRRLVPAGSVLFLALEGNISTRRAWAERIWLSPVSDDEQASRDGFGIALLGTWDGTCPCPNLEDLS